MFEPLHDARYPQITQQEQFRSDGPETRMHTYDPEREGMEAEHRLDSGEAVQTHKRLLAHYINEIDTQSEPREQMREDERFYDGDQWDHSDAAMLRRRGQMPLVFNVIAPAINWMLGTERQNRAQYKVLPREKSDAKAAGLKSELLKYVDDANNTDYAWSAAFAGAVRVGLGWIEEGWQGDSGEEPIFVRAENWRNIVWDSRAQNLDLSDARYLFRAKWVDLDMAVKLFPDARSRALLERSSQTSGDVIGTILSSGDESMDEGERISTLTGENMQGDADRRRLRLIEAWYRVVEDRAYVSGGQFHGELFDVASPGHNQQVEQGKAKIRWRTAMTIRVAIMTSTGLLWDTPSPYRHNRFPFTPVWGNRRGSDNMPYGLVRPLKDIQRDVNKRHSKALHILNSSKVVMDEGAVEDVEELAEEIAQPDAIIVKKHGKELTFDHGKELAPAQIDLMSRSIQMVQQTSGITDEAMGRATNANSGKAILARQQQGSVATAHFMDNLRLARRLSGEKLLSLVEQFYTDAKAFRITNNRGSAQYLNVNDTAENDILRSKADYVIADDAWRATQRQGQLQELTDVLGQIAPMAPEVVMALLDLLIEAMDIPNRDEIVGRIRKITGQTDPDMSDEEKAADPDLQARTAMEAEQAAMMKRQAEAAIGKTEAEAKERGARAKLAEAQTNTSQADAVQKRIGAGQAAIEAAIALLQSAAAAPIADRLLDEAEGGGASADMTVADLQGIQAELPVPNDNMTGPMPQIDGNVPGNALQATLPSEEIA